MDSPILEDFDEMDIDEVTTRDIRKIIFVNNLKKVSFVFK